MKSIISSVVMTLCLWVFNPADKIGLILSIIIGIFVYFGMLLLQRGLKKEEVRLIFETLGLHSIASKLFVQK
jgi:hypothetical protein